MAAHYELLCWLITGTLPTQFNIELEIDLTQTQPPQETMPWATSQRPRTPSPKG